MHLDALLEMTPSIEFDLGKKLFGLDMIHHQKQNFSNYFDELPTAVFYVLYNMALEIVFIKLLYDLPCQFKLGIRVGPRSNASVVSILVMFLLFNVGKGTKRPPRTISRLLHIMTLCTLIDVRMELLFGSRVAHWAIVTFITLNIAIRIVLPVSSAYLLRILPIFADFFDSRTWCRSVFELLRIPSSVLCIVIVWTCISLATESRLFLTCFSFIITQNKFGIIPL